VCVCVCVCVCVHRVFERERERLRETMTINEMRDLSEMWGGGFTGNLKKEKEDKRTFTGIIR